MGAENIAVNELPISIKWLAKKIPEVFNIRDFNFYKSKDYFNSSSMSVEALIFASTFW